MRKILLLAAMLLVVVAAVSAKSPDFAGESLNYRVMFKWGLVNKKAGLVNLSTYADGNVLKSVLSAASERWADRFYRVRDTLRGTMDRRTLEPDFYEKISHEGGQFKHDVIRYDRGEPGIVTATCVRTRQKKESAPVTTSEITLESTGLTLDMLSAYYYMRSMDYESMKPGDSVSMTVFSGKRKETLTIAYKGEEQIEVKGEKYPCYAISFRFTGDGGKKTSDDMFAWISSADDRVPIKLEGKLPVGKVQCYFTGKGK